MKNLKIDRIVNATANPKDGVVSIETVLTDGSSSILTMDLTTAKNLSSTLFQISLKADWATQSSEKSNIERQVIEPQSLQLGADKQGEVCLLVLDDGLQSEANYLLSTRLFWNLAQSVTKLLSKMSQEPPTKLN